MFIVINNNKISNFFLAQHIEKSQNISKGLFFENTEDACDYLTPLHTIISKPIYIFINKDMPHINGWEFLERYAFVENNNYNIHIVLMTKNELDIEEEIKINNYPNVIARNISEIDNLFIDDFVSKMHKSFLLKTV
ncbi:hypothetical protein [uncultured Aquimarina sp.]|uniref:hypothetical protein n=1 Tax=uncultured Aquimarina sp. TaxID=575652 RepID=UPI00262D4C75|nr:hypothetical protein [uncultured Aquimarina sp.]